MGEETQRKTYYHLLADNELHNGNYHLAANYYYHAGLVDKAVEVAIKNLSDIARAGSMLAQVQRYEEAGDVCAQHNSLEQAQKYYLVALRQSFEQNNPTRAATIAVKMGDSITAIHICDRAELYEQGGDLCTTLGNHEQAHQFYQKAYNYYDHVCAREKSLALARKLNDAERIKWYGGL